VLLFPFLSGTDDVLWSPSVSHVISRSDDDEDFSVLFLFSKEQEDGSKCVTQVVRRMQFD